MRERMANRFEVDQRAALFSSRFKADQAARQREDLHAAHSREEMAHLNDAQIEDLEARVSTLGGIADAIKKEAEDSNAMLSTVSSDFDKAGALLAGTMGHLKRMVQERTGRHMCILVVFALALFFAMYLLRRLG